MNTSFNNTNGQ